MAQVVDGAAFHPARDGYELAGDVPRQLVGGEHDDGARDVLRGRDLAERHRPADPLDERRVELAARHRRVRPAGRDGIDAAVRRDPDDLVLEREEQPALERRLRRGVVGVPGLAEAPRGRADEHEVAAAGALDAAEEAARGEERRGEVRVERRAPALERELPDRLVVARPVARDRGADVEIARRREERVHLRLVGEIGLERSRADLGGELLGALAARVVVDDDLGALGRERAHARRPDPAGAAGDEDALACKACLHGHDVIVPF